jgi:hypothetical protein
MGQKKGNHRGLPLFVKREAEKRFETGNQEYDG